MDINFSYVLSYVMLYYWIIHCMCVLCVSVCFYTACIPSFLPLIYSVVNCTHPSDILQTLFYIILRVETDMYNFVLELIKFFGATSSLSSSYLSLPVVLKHTCWVEGTFCSRMCSGAKSCFNHACVFQP